MEFTCSSCCKEIENPTVECIGPLDAFFCDKCMADLDELYEEKQRKIEFLKQKEKSRTNPRSTQNGEIQELKEKLKVQDEKIDELKRLTEKLLEFHQ